MGFVVCGVFVVVWVEFCYFYVIRIVLVVFFGDVVVFFVFGVGECDFWVNVVGFFGYFFYF